MLCALAFLLLPAAAVAPTQLWLLALAAALAVATGRLVAQGPWPSGRSAFAVLAGVFVLWGLASALWAIDPSRSISTALRIGLVAAGLVFLLDAARRLTPEARDRFERWLVSGAIAGMVVIAAALALSGALTAWLEGKPSPPHALDALNRTSAIVAILVWPVALSVCRRHGRKAAAAVVLLAAAAVYALAPATPLFAFLLGGATLVIAWFSQRTGRALLVVVFVGSVVTIPFLEYIVPPINEVLAANIAWPNSEVHRFVIWQFAAEHILERPLFGWGLDAARTMPGGNVDVVLFTKPDGRYAMGPQLPLHTHNALIQIWLEIGIVGVILACGLFVVMLRRLPRCLSERLQQASAIATLMTAFAIAQLGFGIWQGWWMASLGMIAVMVTGLYAPRDVPRGSPESSMAGRAAAGTPTAG